MSLSGNVIAIEFPDASIKVYKSLKFQLRESSRNPEAQMPHWNEFVLGLVGPWNRVVRLGHSCKNFPGAGVYRIRH